MGLEPRNYALRNHTAGGKALFPGCPHPAPRGRCGAARHPLPVSFPGRTPSALLPARRTHTAGPASGQLLLRLTLLVHQLRAAPGTARAFFPLFPARRRAAPGGERSPLRPSALGRRGAGSLVPSAPSDTDHRQLPRDHGWDAEKPPSGVSGRSPGVPAPQPGRGDGPRAPRPALPALPALGPRRAPPPPSHVGGPATTVGSARARRRRSALGGRSASIPHK